MTKSNVLYHWYANHALVKSKSKGSCRAFQSVHVNEIVRLFHKCCSISATNGTIFNLKPPSESCGEALFSQKCGVNYESSYANHLSAVKIIVWFNSIHPFQISKHFGISKILKKKTKKKIIEKQK